MSNPTNGPAGRQALTEEFLLTADGETAFLIRTDAPLHEGEKNAVLGLLSWLLRSPDRTVVQMYLEDGRSALPPQDEDST